MLLLFLYYIEELVSSGTHFRKKKYGLLVLILLLHQLQALHIDKQHSDWNTICEWNGVTVIFLPI